MDSDAALGICMTPVNPVPSPRVFEHSARTHLHMRGHRFVPQVIALPPPEGCCEWLLTDRLGGSPVVLCVSNPECHPLDFTVVESDKVGLPWPSGGEIDVDGLVTAGGWAAGGGGRGRRGFA